MKRLNKAFTLTELLVALGVIAILCSILLPVIFNMMPNQNTIMAKRAYYTVQSVVADLINDEACYPDKTSASVASEKRIGFDDAEGSPNCIGWSSTGVSDSSAKATEKFIKLFGNKISVEDATVSNVFSTADSIQWYFDGNGFNAHTGDGGSIKLIVDVNGGGDPNCAPSNKYTGKFPSDGTDCASRDKGFDRFQMTIYGNGSVAINDTWAQNAVKVDRNITGNGTSNATDQ